MPYQVRAGNKQARVIEQWRRDPDLIADIDAMLDHLAEHPMAVPDEPKSIKHLKGKRLCCREYRKLKINRRVFYRIDDGTMTVNIIEAMNHPKTDVS